jgi:dipeptidyl aminopeptidase/acylaminoacyl peptidase
VSDLNDLINQGIEAARARDRETARKLFEQVVEQDEENIRGWLLLSRVVENIDEKRICLTTVLQLDPDNKRAQQELEELDAKISKTKADEEIVPGVTRRQMRLIVGGAGALVIVVLLIVVIIVASKNSKDASERRALQNTIAAETRIAQAAIAEITQTAAELTEEATAAAATMFAQTSPTPSPTITRSAIDYPTWTPTAEPTEPVTATPLAYPDNLPGSIVAWSGKDILNNDFLNIVMFPLAGRGQSTRVGENTGRFPIISPTSPRIIYTRYYDTASTFGLEAINTNGTQPENLSERWQNYETFVEATMASFSGNGDQIVFVAKAADTATTEVYLLNLTVQSGNPIIRLTEDSATYTYPALSPDGSKLVVVRNDKNSVSPGEDLVIITIANRAQQALTTDLGSFIEMSPRWSPDGSLIAYAVAPSTDPKNHEIRIVNADGSGTPREPVRSPADEIYPVFSPDGKYIAFASSRTGAYDIFIYQFTTTMLWQLTNTAEEDYPGGWTYN